MIKKNTFRWMSILSFLWAFSAISGYAQVQNTMVTGQIIDQQTGETMPGVNIAVKGTTVGTVTDTQGNYKLNVPSLSDTLVISFVGYQKLQVPIGGRQTINVEMKSQRLRGKELVVVGFGTQEQENVTSSISRVDSSEFNSGEISNSAKLIQGKVAGLQISKPGSDPNGGYTIRLRGLSTLGANSEPLVVINGVPGASLDNVDPNDIKSINVLKDASASAIYGTRGSNGVIIVETKSGKTVEGNKSEFSVEYKGSTTLTEPFRRVDVLSADEYRDFLKFYGNQTGQDLSGSDFGSSTDWYDQITRDRAYGQAHYLALSGGNNSTNYRASLNYRDRKGILKNTGFDEINARLNLNQTALDNKLTINFNVAANRKNSKFGFNDAFQYATVYNPTQPVRDEDFPQYGGYFQQLQTNYNNPVSIVEQQRNDGKNVGVNGNLKVDYLFSDLIPGLSVSGLYSELHSEFSGGRYAPSTALYNNGYNRNGVANRRQSNDSNRLLQVTSHYKQTIAERLDLNAFVGYSWQKFTNDGFNMDGGNFITDQFSYNNFSAAQEFQSGIGTVNSFESNHKLIAGFGRVNLKYDNTYLLSGSLRREGSSRFGKNNKWGTFYAVNGGIRLENLFDISLFQQLKLRAGYGVTGNDAPESYLSKSTFSPQGFFVANGNYIPSYGPSNNPNPNLKWERKKEINIGVDFSLLKNRLTGSIDAYSNKTTDLLLDFPVPVPPNIYGTEWVNIGTLSNKGIEFNLNYKIFQTNNFLWQTGIVGSRHKRTKIESLSNENLQFGDQNIIRNLGAPGLNSTNIIRVKEGEPVGQLWGPIYEGITDGGHWKFKDLNDDGTIDKADNTVIGNGQPKFSANWSNRFNYKRWSLNFNIRGVFGHDLLNTFRTFYQNPSAVGSYNILKSSLDIENLVDPPQFSSFQVENASFVELNNAALGYTFRLENVSTISSVTLTFVGENLFLITNYSGPDPKPRYSDGGNPLAPGIARRSTWLNDRQYTFRVDIKF